MDRIRQIWIESARSSSTLESYGGGEGTAPTPQPPPNHPTLCSQQAHVNANSRPPPLRTSSTYDDDDAFNNVALNLLSRHEILGLSSTEAILATLVTPKQRASFYEGLLLRLDRSSHLSPHAASLVFSLERTFGSSLKTMTDEDDSSQNHHNDRGSSDPSLSCYSTHNSKKPTSPRNHPYSLGHMFGGSSGMAPAATCRNQGRKKSTPRRFFPEGNHAGDKPPSMGLFGGSNKRRVRNIDWKIAEAIQQVNHLQLDGDSPVSANYGGQGYEPPRRF